MLRKEQLLLVLFAFFVLPLSPSAKDKIGLKDLSEEKRNFYPESYEDSRKHFRELAEVLSSKYPSVHLQTHAVPSEEFKNLSIESLYIPQSKGTDRLLILTSGVHGAEAFTGSALQSYFLNHTLTPELLKNMGVLIVHAVNPYGFHKGRRVSENNVDLNRNFSLNDELYDSKNEAYDRLATFLNPNEKAHHSWWHNLNLFFGSLWRVIEYGKKDLTQAIVGGQYKHYQGIQFGGNRREPNVEVIRQIFQRYGSQYDTLFHADFHTGYGAWGKLHYFVHNNIKPKSLQARNTLFKDIKMDSGDDKDFYNTTGEFTSFTIALFPNKLVIPVTLEFGTLDSQSIIGGYLSLRNLIYENQGHFHGYTSSNSERSIKKEFREMFSPSDPAWRDKVFSQYKDTFHKVIKRFSDFSAEGNQ